MITKLTDFIYANRDRLLEQNIFIDEIKSSELEFTEEAEQVDLINETAFARITLFKSNRLYIQILDIESDEVLDKEVNINEFIMDAIYKMKK